MVGGDGRTPALGDARGGRGAGDRWRATGTRPAAVCGDRHVRFELVVELSRDRRLLPALRRRHGRDPGPRAAYRSRRDGRPRATVRARGVPRRPGRKGQPDAAVVHGRAACFAPDPVRGDELALRAPVQGAPDAGGVRAGDVPQPGGVGGEQEHRGAAAGRAAVDPASGGRGLPAGNLEGVQQEEGDGGRKRGGGAGAEPGIPAAGGVLPPIRDQRHADDLGPAVHPADRVRPVARREPAEGSVRVPVPDVEVRADPGAVALLALLHR